MDIADQANDLIEKETAARLATRQVMMLQPCGSCHNCGEDIEPGRVFCAGVDCRNDYDKRLRAQKNRPVGRL
jgi:predicted nucleic acid-binding Zn ribbon protein